MDKSRIVSILVIALGILMLIFQYYEIPFFGVFFLLIFFLIIKFLKVEKKMFKKEFDRYKFDFNVRKYSQDNKLVKTLKISTVILTYMASFTVTIHFGIREYSLFDLLYFFAYWGLFYYLDELHELYNYYYFNNEFIKKPGKDFEKIFWTDIYKVEDNEKDEVFLLHLKTGETIKFGSETYYTLGKNKNEIIEYIKFQIQTLYNMV